MKTRPTVAKCLRYVHGHLEFRSAASTLARLREELTSRPRNVIYDYLTPTSSHLLNVSLADFIPESCYPDNFKVSFIDSYGIGRGDGVNLNKPAIPDGHHLVYFPPAVPHSSLLPDGTDTLHSPGIPFNRRMWAGGSLIFPSKQSSRLTLSGEPAACVEGIRDVSIKGEPGNEKIFVHIERRVGVWRQSEKMTEQEISQRFWDPEPTFLGQAALVERRNLVFMRDTPPDALLRKDRAIKMSRVPDFTTSLRIPSSLLFRFSALTFNAHAIHLDPQYVREVERFPGLIVHGPLSLVLMLSVLRSQLNKEESLISFEYRNLAPLYAEEEISLCVRKESVAEGRYDVWIESAARGLAVKGSATTRLSARKR